ncbi:MAG: cbb3-type cytochrome oxidase assembly protein CcoS [Helicobacter sp.]|nr:cbb3-type cytochrome oxidase assembly protein CcoS [Helicobacter sp.]
MNTGIVAVMIGVSILIGLIGLICFLWGLRSGQFDDEHKMRQGILFDSPSDLQRAMNQKGEKREG